jgi:hypothetical protein
MLLTPLSLESFNIVVPDVVPRFAFRLLPIFVNMDFVFIPSVSEATPSRDPCLPISPRHFLAVLLNIVAAIKR